MAAADHSAVGSRRSALSEERSLRLPSLASGFGLARSARGVAFAERDDVVLPAAGLGQLLAAEARLDGVVLALFAVGPGQGAVGGDGGGGDVVVDEDVETDRAAQAGVARRGPRLLVLARESARG